MLSHFCILFHSFIWLFLHYVSLFVCSLVLFYFFFAKGGGGGVKSGQLLSREARDTSIFSANLVPKCSDPFVRYQV